MFTSKMPGIAFWFAVNNKVNIPLAVQGDIFGTVSGYLGKAHVFKKRFELPALWAGKLDKFKAIQTHRIVEQIGHRKAPVKCSPRESGYGMGQYDLSLISKFTINNK